jgi:protein transport protein SEC61 subunit gamma-like protein
MRFPNIKLLLEGYWRVLRLTKKPTGDDYWFTAKICAAGMIIIGLVGFVLYLTAILLGM